jgi:hypothetical protein
MLKRFLITCTVWILASQNVYGDSNNLLPANAKRKSLTKAEIPVTREAMPEYMLEQLKHDPFAGSC